MNVNTWQDTSSEYCWSNDSKIAVSSVYCKRNDYKNSHIFAMNNECICLVPLFQPHFEEWKSFRSQQKNIFHYRIWILVWLSLLYPCQLQVSLHAGLEQVFAHNASFWWATQEVHPRVLYTLFRYWMHHPAFHILLWNMCAQFRSHCCNWLYPSSNICTIISMCHNDARAATNFKT